jgi:hypothetical protein
MNKYNNSKIYKIVDNTNGNVYIGSTIQKYITYRLSKHVSNYRLYLKDKYHYVTSFEIIKNGNYDIVLIENVNCETKEQLHARERFYIETIECINKCIPNRSRKEYRNTHRDDKNRKNLEFYHKNKNEINEKKKQKFTCCCGSKCNISEKPRHERSIKHQTYLKNQAILVLDTSNPDTR